MKKVYLAVLILALLFSTIVTSYATTTVMTSAPQQYNFEDTTNHWGKASIDYVAQKGIMKGYSLSKFGPNDTITIGQYLTIIVRVLGGESSVGEESRLNAIKLGIISKDELNVPHNTPITRSDMAMLTVRAYRALYPDAEYPNGVPLAYIAKIKDYSDLSTGDQYYSMICLIKGIMMGDNTGKFNPSGISTRATAAAFIHRLLDETESAKVRKAAGIFDAQFLDFGDGNSHSDEANVQVFVDTLGKPVNGQIKYYVYRTTMLDGYYALDVVISNGTDTAIPIPPYEVMNLMYQGEIQSTIIIDPNEWYAPQEPGTYRWIRTYQKNEGLLVDTLPEGGMTLVESQTK